MSRRVATLGLVLSSLVVACSALTDVADLSGNVSAGGAAGAVANGGQSAGTGGSGGAAKGGSAGASAAAGAGGKGAMAGGGGASGSSVGGSAGGGMAGASGATGGNGGTSSAGTGGTGGAGGGAAGSTLNGGSSGSAGSAGSAGGAVYPCDTDVAGDGIYVSPSGAQGALGTASTPVRTIGAAIELAAAQKKATVYIEEGAYGESVGLGESFGKAINLDGGWRRIAGKWTRLCGETATTTIIQGPNGRALEVVNSPGKVRLRHLTLTTYADVPEPGRTHYGVFAVGTPTKPVSIDLEDVVLSPGKGEDGAAVKDGDAAAAKACNGRTDCASGAKGGQGKAGDAPTKGTFTSGGYVLPVSLPGARGEPGANGSKGGPETTQTSCNIGCELGGVSCNITKGNKTIPAGTCGCGGDGGPGGLGGKAGGGSIGLFVSGSAKVVVLASTLRTSPGGNGSAPGGPGKGGVGAAGESSPGICCDGLCPVSSDPSVCNSATPSPPGVCGDERSGNPAGGLGGDGGLGGLGAHGLGGPSICVVAQGGGDAQIGESVVLEAKAGGTSGGVLPPGDSKPFVNLP